MLERLRNRCDQRWADLVPRGEGRYCGKCDTTVVDLSRLTKRGAQARSEGGGCFRVRIDDGGAPIFRSEPERRLGRKALAMAAALAGCSAPAAPISEVAEVSAEPPALPDDVTDDVPAGVALEELMSVEVVPPQADQDATPNAEQLARTARKHAPPASAPTHYPGYEIMGGFAY
jgi:hypothetical protein